MGKRIIRPGAPNPTSTSSSSAPGQPEPAVGQPPADASPTPLSTASAAVPESDASPLQNTQEGPSGVRGVAGEVTRQVTGLRNWVNGMTQTSSGVPDLDSVMGGGLVMGEMIGWLPDRNTSYAQDAFVQSFIAEGVLHGHSMIFLDPALRMGGGGQSVRPLAFTLEDMVRYELGPEEQTVTTEDGNAASTSLQNPHVVIASRKAPRTYDSLCDAIRLLKRQLKFHEWFAGEGPKDAAPGAMNPQPSTGSQAKPGATGSSGSSISSSKTVLTTQSTLRSKLSMLAIAEDAEEDDEEAGDDVDGEDINAVKAKAKAIVRKHVSTSVISEEDETREDDEQDGDESGAKQTSTKVSTIGALDEALNAEESTGPLKIAWQYNKYVRPLDAGSNLAPIQGSTRSKPASEQIAGPEGRSYRRPIFIIPASSTTVSTDNVLTSGMTSAAKPAVKPPGFLPNFACLDVPTTTTNVIPADSLVNRILADTFKILKQEQCITPAGVSSVAKSGGFARIIVSCEHLLSVFADPTDSLQTSAYPHMVKLLHGLQMLARKTRAVVCIVAPKPSELTISQSVRSLVCNLAGTVISVQSFGDDVWKQRGTITAFGDFDGFVTIVKFGRPKSLVPAYNLPETPHMLFKRNLASSRPLRLQRLALGAEHTRAGNAATTGNPPLSTSMTEDKQSARKSGRDVDDAKSLAASAADMF